MALVNLERDARRVGDRVGDVEGGRACLDEGGRGGAAIEGAGAQVDKGVEADRGGSRVDGGACERDAFAGAPGGEGAMTECQEAEVRAIGCGGGERG